jgi:uncharacterized membrane protein
MKIAARFITKRYVATIKKKRCHKHRAKRALRRMRIDDKVVEFIIIIIILFFRFFFRTKCLPILIKQ